MRMLVVVALIASTGIAVAQTPEERAACTTDALTFCSSVIDRGRDAIARCLRSHIRVINKECAALVARHK